MSLMLVDKDKVIILVNFYNIIGSYYQDIYYWQSVYECVCMRE